MEEEEIIERYMILLLGIVNRPIPSITHFQKEMFIFTKVNPKFQEIFEFEKYHYGPYSQALAEITEEPLYYENAWYRNKEGKICLTSEGKKIFNKILEEKSNDKDFSETIASLKLIRNLYDKLSNEELLFLIYATYPEFTKFSSVSNKIINKKPKILKNLLKKGLITKKRYEELKCL